MVFATKHPTFMDAHDPQDLPTIFERLSFVTFLLHEEIDTREKLKRERERLTSEFNALLAGRDQVAA